MGIERKFLGWDEPGLERACEALFELAQVKSGGGSELAKFGALFEHVRVPSGGIDADLSDFVVVLLSIERVMSLLRLLSEELSLDDLLPSLRIEVVHNPLAASSYLLSFQSSDSLLLDRAARLARLVGAQLCVGAGQHFEAYRDEHAPLGYDVRQPLTEPGDLALYTPTFAQPYRRVREVRLSQLLGQLQLLPLPGGLRAQLCPPEVDGYAERAVTPAGQAETFLTQGAQLS